MQALAPRTLARAGLTTRQLFIPSISRSLVHSSLSPVRPISLPLVSPSLPTVRTIHHSSRLRNSQSSQDSTTEPPPQGAYAKFKALTKKYGWYALGMYTFLSAIDFSLSFIAVHAAGIERVEPIWNVALRKYRVIRHGEQGADELEKEDHARKLEIKEQEQRDKANGVKKDANVWLTKALWAEIALAYAIHKIALLPVRAGLTAAVTPKFVNWLAARGWVGKGGITRAASHAQDKVRNASDRVKDRVKTLREKE